MSHQMNPEIKQLWIAKLRSGEIKQTKGELTRRQPDGSLQCCCLGVLCEQAAEKGVVKRAIDADGVISYRAPGDSRGDASVLPKAVMEWAGIDNPYGRYGDEYLIVDNDSRKKSFGEIASIIEEHF